MVKEGTDTHKVPAERDLSYADGLNPYDILCGGRVRALFRRRCRHLHAAIHELGRDFSLFGNGGSLLTYRGLACSIPRLRLSLAGEHQLGNAALALAAVEILRKNGFAIQDSAIRRGLRAAVWPGRLERAGSSPMLVLDGAHNPAAIRKLATALTGLFSYRRLFFIIGIMADKNIPAMMRAIAPIADRIILCRPRMVRARPPDRRR